MNQVRSGPSSATKKHTNSQYDSDFSEDNYENQAGPQSSLVKNNLVRNEDLLIKILPKSQEPQTRLQEFHF